MILMAELWFPRHFKNIIFTTFRRPRKHHLRNLTSQVLDTETTPKAVNVFNGRAPTRSMVENHNWRKWTTQFQKKPIPRHQKLHIHPKLDVGSKPSTLFPPGGLVKLPTIVSWPTVAAPTASSRQHFWQRSNSPENNPPITESRKRTQTVPQVILTPAISFPWHKNSLFPEHFGDEKSSSRRHFPPEFKLPESYSPTTKTTQKYSCGAPAMARMPELWFPRHLVIISSQHFGVQKSIT